MKTVPRTLAGVNMDERDERMLLTTSGVADLLGIHPSTVKRWCDEGSLPTGKTDGGHRRIHLRDALATARERGIPTFLDLFQPWEANVWLAFTEAAQDGRSHRLESLALSWLSQGETDLLAHLLFEMGRRPEIPFPLFLDRVVRGFMARVGEEWRKGKLLVGEEHMATQVVHEALVRLRAGWERPAAPSRDAPDPLPVAVVGSMEGDQHDLGAQSIRVLLEGMGWRVYYLGANVPVEEFAAIQQAQGASLVCISFAPTHTLPDLQRAVRVLGEFYRVQYPYALALGGTLLDPAMGPVPEGPFEAFTVCHSAESFHHWIRATFPGKDDGGQSRRIA